MKTMLRFALPGLCGLLATVVVAEAYFAAPEDRAQTAALSALNHNTGKSAAGRTGRMVAEILQRPLFTQGREPPRIKVVKAEPPKLQGRLAGVMLRPDRNEALFTRPGGRPIAVKEGDTIDGFTVGKIEAGRVVLTSAFGEQVVKPTNGGAEEAGAPVHRAVIKKTAPTQTPPPAQRPQQLTQAAGAGSTGQR